MAKIIYFHNDRLQFQLTYPNIPDSVRVRNSVHNFPECQLPHNGMFEAV